MGCDIHLYVEKRTSANAKWQSADKWTPDEDTPKRKRVAYKDEFYGGRNYNLFSMLADVRNGRGFAGVKTGAGFQPIAAPKGLPEDCCALVQAESDGWDCDGHSHSFLTVAELMAYDWTQTTTLCGDVSGVEYAEWRRWRKENGQGPESYCGSCHGQAIRHISPDEMDKVVSKAEKEIEHLRGMGSKWTEALAEKVGNYHTQVEWTEPYYRAAEEFLSSTLPRLWRLGTPENVRIVFWFDN